MWNKIIILTCFVALLSKPVSGDNSPNKEGTKFTNSIGMTFVKIEPGEFLMGSLKDKIGNKKQHRVVLSKAFYMQTTEVTQGQWKAVMQDDLSVWSTPMELNPSHFSACGDDCPVENVPRISVEKFIRHLNRKEGTNKYQLPTEAQWEYACRAGTTTLYYNGDTEEDLSRAAWYSGNSERMTHPVGQKEPNPWGLYDMLGNVAEYCLDWYGEYPAGSVTDPEGPPSGEFRVNRGGSYSAWPFLCTPATRFRPTSSYRRYGSDTGFRLIRKP